MPAVGDGGRNGGRRQPRSVVGDVQPPTNDVGRERFHALEVLEPPLDHRHFFAAVHALYLNVESACSSHTVQVVWVFIAD